MLAHLVVSLDSLPVSLNEGLDLVVLILRVEQVLLEVGHRPLHGLLQDPGLVLVEVVHLLGGLQVIAVGAVASQFLLEELGRQNRDVVWILVDHESLLVRLFG